MLETNFCGIKMKNPTVLASGILGVTKSSLNNVVKNGAGAVTMKSISQEPRKGHNNPIMLTFEGGMMNAVGYSNPGLEVAKEEYKDMSDLGAPFIASFVGGNAEDFGYMAKNFLNNKTFSAIEIPLSCPHTPGFGTLAGQNTPEATEEITKAVRKHTDLPIIVKLSPISQNIAEIAQAAEKAGASAVNMGNTHGPGMVINVETKQPVLDFKIGGVSGPAIRPIAVRCVYDLYKAIKIPIMGTGGVTTWRDAVEMMMAGATTVGIGSAVYYDSLGVFNNVCSGMKKFMEKEGYSNVKELIGVAHNE